MMLWVNRLLCKWFGHRKIVSYYAGNHYICDGCAKCDMMWSNPHHKEGN